MQSCWIEHWGDHPCKRKFRMRKLQLPTFKPRQRLFCILQMAWPLLLISSVRVATLAMKPRMVELWKCRVQHLRRFYSYQKCKQTGHSVVSGDVWYLPVLLMMWLIVSSCSVFLTLMLNATYERDKGKPFTLNPAGIAYRRLRSLFEI